MLTRQNKYSEAKVLLPQLKENAYKWYYSALIAAYEGDQNQYEQDKSRIMDKTLLTFLTIEEMFKQGKKAEALTTAVEEQINKLKGLKLLTIVHYKEELLKR